METRTASERVADKVRAIADQAGHSQKYLARILHTTQQTVSRKLHGEIPFRLDEIDALADALHVEPETLITRDTKK